MKENRIYIRNMVCNRCKMAVRSEFEKLGIKPISVELGEVVTENELTEKQRQQLSASLESLGFSIIDDKKSRLIGQIKTAIIELVQNKNSELKVNLSDYISSKLNHDYNYLSSLFSEVEGVTIEKYFIAQKIEKVKELLVYDELSLSEIAYKLNYSSVAHLSSQFKKVTGLPPSHFRELRHSGRKPLDEI